MRQFKTSHIPAMHLMQDDRFKMGGEMYQILRITTNAFGDKVITFTSWTGGACNCMTLIVPRHTMFKVYNQQ